MNINRFFALVLISFLVVGLSPKNAAAQTSCAEKLEFAQQLFDQGKINDVEETIAGCFENGFTKEEKIQAYKLLSITHTYLEEDDLADESVLGLLRFDPEYAVNPDLDPTEFIKLYQKFRTTPVFQVGLKFGTNMNFFNVKNTYELGSSLTSTTTFVSAYGINAGVGFEIPMGKGFEFVPEFHFSQRSYDITHNVDAGQPISVFTATENQTFIEVPLLFRYDFKVNKVIPFVELGGTASYLIAAEMTTIENQSEAGVADGPNIDMMKQREFSHLYASGGLGIKYHIPMSILELQARFNYAIMDINKKGNSQSENDLRTLYSYVEPDFSINYLTITISYMRKIYKPKKLID